LHAAGNELGERLAFYGIMSNMVIYMTRVMHYDPAFASVQLMLFEGTCYLTPILGAWLADSRWGRFKCILVFSIIYFVVRAVFDQSTLWCAQNLIIYFLVRAAFTQTRSWNVQAFCMHASACHHACPSCCASQASAARSLLWKPRCAWSRRHQSVGCSRRSKDLGAAAERRLFWRRACWRWR
jgi:hypothetical protein